MIAIKGKYSPKVKEEIRETLDAYEEFLISLKGQMDMAPNREKVRNMREIYQKSIPEDMPIPRLIKMIDSKLKKYAHPVHH